MVKSIVLKIESDDYHFKHLKFAIQYCKNININVHFISEIVRAFTHVINQGWAMYWGTSRWSPMEIMVSIMVTHVELN